MKTTSHTARLAELIAADKAEYAASKSYRRGMLEGGEGYNPHDSRREEIGKEILRLSILDFAERAENLTAEETATIRAWVNSNKFRSASAADNALREKKDITLDGLKSAMARHGIA
jgi:hypothetical protein